MSEQRVVGYFMSVTPAVKRYLEYWMPVKCYLGIRKPDMYMASKDDLVGMWLINSFTRKTKQVCELSLGEAAKMGYTDIWPFAIPIRYQDNMLLPERRIGQFNTFMLKLMSFELVNDMELIRTTGNVLYIQQAINDFRDKYKIYEEDWPDERIRKMYLRWRVHSKTIRTECGNYLPGMLLGKI